MEQQEGGRCGTGFHAGAADCRPGGWLIVRGLMSRSYTLFRQSRSRAVCLALDGSCNGNPVGRLDALTLGWTGGVSQDTVAYFMKEVK